jgi:hypothetical protein
MKVLIRDQLVCPPTWFLSFRDLTLYCNVFLKHEVLIETEDTDIYYPWIKTRGGMDFIEDFVVPGIEEGLRIDFDRHFPNTIITDRIAPENVQKLIGKIRAFTI